MYSLLLVFISHLLRVSHCNTDNNNVLSKQVSQPTYPPPTFETIKRVTDTFTLTKVVTISEPQDAGDPKVFTGVTVNVSERSYSKYKESAPKPKPVVQPLSVVEPKPAQTQEEFEKSIKEDLESLDKGAAYVPSKVSTEKRELKIKPERTSFNRRPLDAPVKRWEHKEKIDSRDADGCGNPVCAIVDARPKRFSSLCRFFHHLSHFELYRRFFHLQKGDCANAIENQGLDWNWGSNPQDDCRACGSSSGCNTTICLAVGNKASTYKNVCEAMKYLHDKKDAMTIMASLGDCGTLLKKDTCLYTEWFDIDEPCRVGDIESATQNLALAATYKKTGRFRMCPRARQVKEPEFLTIEGGDIPSDQVVERDLKNHKFVCKNENQLKELKPPHYWYTKKLKCRDYKIRHCCQCLHGCVESAKDNQYEFESPPIKTLFEECEWRPFVSNESPRPDTWDGEDRAAALKYGTGNHVCGSKPFDAMYIDVRRRSDDTPWDETGEYITKNTPWFGFLCINKNNAIFGMSCSDYKVRYCCVKSRPAQWGKWSQWSKCTKTCGGGMRSRNRICVMKEGEKETCFGNWIDKDENGKDKYIDLKKQVHKCHEKRCPEDYEFTPWRAWEACPITCGSAQRRRRRGCNPAKQGGKMCPTEKSHYQEFEDCKLPKCPDPQWTAWSKWSYCSLSCGLGVRRRDRKCEDTITKKPMDAFLDCIGGSEQMKEDCKLKDCPIDGQWTEWLNWGACNILCGTGGKQLRRRYCTKPIPQFGGKQCIGKGTEERICQNIPPCPQHCEWSLWGEWSPCSVSCGFPGAGLQTRGRHKAVEANYGGRECQNKTTENRICFHVKMKAVRENQLNISNPITFCPIDCVWAKWSAWSSCPDCYGDLSGIYEEDLGEYEQVRQRKIKTRSKFRGKRCKAPVELESRQGQCNKDIVPKCPEAAGGSFESQWSPWSGCLSACGREGKRERKRECYGRSCAGKLLEVETCNGYCPPEGWSQWDKWSNCQVTCGYGQRARRRFCLDDNKEEFKKDIGRHASTCRGIARETQRCDMGQCGSKIKLQYEGGDKDPVLAYEEANQNKIRNNQVTTEARQYPQGGTTTTFSPMEAANIQKMTTTSLPVNPIQGSGLPNMVDLSTMTKRTSTTYYSSINIQKD